MCEALSLMLISIESSICNLRFLESSKVTIDYSIVLSQCTVNHALKENRKLICRSSSTDLTSEQSKKEVKMFPFRFHSFQSFVARTRFIFFLPVPVKEKKD